jgi:hypothetical protein
MHHPALALLILLLSFGKKVWMAPFHVERPPIIMATMAVDFDYEGSPSIVEGCRQSWSIAVIWTAGADFRVSAVYCGHPNQIDKEHQQTNAGETHSKRWSPSIIDGTLNMATHRDEACSKRW